MLLIVAAFIFHIFVITAKCAEVCGAQSWFHGWDNNFAVVYQVMDFSNAYNRIAVGAKYPDLTLPGVWYSMLLTYSSVTEDLHDYIFLASWEIISTVPSTIVAL